MYNPILKFVHKIFICLRFDDFIANYFSTIYLSKWLIPSHTLYACNTFKNIKRDNTYFTVDVSDYMQWHIFASIKDIAWEKAVESLSSSSNGIVLDIGSNVGSFALKVASNLELNSTSRVIAFDPNPYIQERFLHNLNFNSRIKFSVKFNLNAVGNETKIVDFSYDSENSGVGKISGVGINRFEISMVTLDDFCKNNNLSNIKFIKIDVEGFEPFVFEGAIEILNIYHPELYFEITEKWHNKYGKSSKYIFDLLKRLNYSLFLVEESNLTLVQNGFEIANNLNQYNFYAKYNCIDIS